MSISIAQSWVVCCCLAVLTTICGQAQDALTLTAPIERQVVQRNGDNQAKVTISGAMKDAGAAIEAKADLVDGAKKGKAVDWTEVAKGDEKAGFSGQLSLEAGGWYTITVRARKEKEILGEVKIAKVGVGDVFITAGQSNSANYGKPRQSAKDDHVVYFNGKAFVLAKDPIPGGCGGGGSIWPILGDHIAKSQGVPVCFRSASQTWTEVKNWLPGVKCRKFFLYKNLVKCTKYFGKGGVRAVLWHQGESDSLAKTMAEQYCQRLKTVIDGLNKEAGYEIPWFVAQASFHPGSKEPQEKQVAQGQQLLWKKKFAHQGPDTDELGQKYRSDRVHFNQLGLTTHADRWFKALSEAYKWKVE